MGMGMGMGKDALPSHPQARPMRPITSRMNCTPYMAWATVADRGCSGFIQEFGLEIEC